MKNKIISKITSGVLLCSMIAYTTPVLALTKEETVYTKIDASGKNYHTMVSTHLINEEQEKLLQDLSDLMEIENTGGEEEVKQEGNQLIWKAEGKDIYYQGKTKRDLPVECKVTYELEGKEITAEELAGQSGKVKIIIKYQNKEQHNVIINGKKQTMYTPFVAVCGTALDNKENRNIQINSGKIVDDGSKILIVGMAFPGLQESLGISKDTLEIPTKIEITMETTNFTLGNIITYITPKVVENDDLELLNKLEKITSQAEILQSSSKQLVKGADTLKEGTTTYSEKTREFNGAMKQVAQGANDANQSYNKIDNGIEVLGKGTKSLQTGAKAVSEGTTAISSNLKIISNKLGELQNGSQELLAGQIQVELGLDQVIAGVKGMTGADTTNQIAQVQKLLEGNIATLEAANLQLEEQVKLDSLDAAIKQALNTQIETNKQTIKSLQMIIKTNQNAVTNAGQAEKQVQTLLSGLEQVKVGVEGLQEGTKALQNGQAAIKQGVDTLTDKTEELAQGTNTLYQGTTQITQGTKELQTGSSQMKEGLNRLEQGSKKLLQADEQLVEGAVTISKGAKTLSEGMKQFDQEGIETISNYLGNHLKELGTKIEKLQDLADQYNHFTMLEENTKGKVKFILIMDSVKKEEQGKQEMILEEKQQEKSISKISGCE